MANTEEQIGALSTAVLNTDKARRVGWARAYSAEQSRDDLARDVNVLRSERDIMRRAWSYMYGFVQAYDSAAHQMINKRAKEMGAIIDPAVANLGRVDGQEQLEKDTERAARRAEWNQAKDERVRIHSNAFKAARRKERRALADQYGFPNETAFLNYLEHYQGGQAT